MASSICVTLLIFFWSLLPPGFGDTGYKTYYKSADSETYDAALLFCKDINGSLVAIQTKAELNNVMKLLRGQAATRLWVGAEPNSKCSSIDDFDPKCWIWQGTQTEINTNVTNFSVGNNNLTRRQEDNSASRGYLNVLRREINVTKMSHRLPYICEFTTTLFQNMKCC